MKNNISPTVEKTAIDVVKFLNLGGYKYKYQDVASWLRRHHNNSYELHCFLEGKFNGALRASIDKDVPYAVENGFEKM